MKYLKQAIWCGLVAGLLTVMAGVYAAPVNINKADDVTLAKGISGIGPAKARAIVAYRKQHGPFKSIHDLAKVKGIGDKLIDKNKSDLKLSDVDVKKASR